jgi:RNA-directed DNA polymerase
MWELADTLARCFLAGEPIADAIVQRASYMLGQEWPWLRRTAQRFVEATQGKTRFRHDDAIGFLLADPDFVHHQPDLATVKLVTEPQRMHPVEAAAGWNLPRLESAADLADWFWLEPAQLDWFADLNALGSKNNGSRLHHYHYRVLPKRHQGFRLIEAPKRRLKSLQKQILEGILDLIPAHPAAHGFVKGRSILTFTAPHVGQACVLRMDLQNFFPSFSCARIQASFRTIGYPEHVAAVLAGVCTNVTPGEVWRSTGEQLYSRRHLPQGAPSSPALANLCAYRMDCRLAGLAGSAGVEYSRYADDLAFLQRLPLDAALCRSHRLNSARRGLCRSASENPHDAAERTAAPCRPDRQPTCQCAASKLR